MQDREGCRTNRTHIEAAAQEMQAIFSFHPDPPNTEVPCEFQFDGSPFCGNEECRIDAYNWDFETTTKHIPTSAKQHTSTEELAHSCCYPHYFSGEKQRQPPKPFIAVNEDYVLVSTPPNSAEKAPLSIRSDPTCSEGGVITDWYWDFGDGTTSSERIPAKHTFQNPGQYSVTLHRDR